VPASIGVALPSVLTDPSISIEQPQGKTATVANPLCHYQFESIPADFGPDDTLTKGNFFHSWDRTYRWPTGQQLNPSEQYDMLNKYVCK
jgi:hypothetical protein